MIARALIAVAIALLFTVFPRVSRAETLPFALPGASAAIDADGDASFEQARTLPYAPASAFRYPGRAWLFKPLVVWIRFPAPLGGPLFLDASPAVGWATVYYRAPGATTYAAKSFGMRQPFAERTVDRVPPTLELPPVEAGTPVYVRLALDDETRVTPALALVDRATLAHQDAVLERLASTAVFFIGIFVSLAAANIFVFLFVRERAYVYYSAMMLSNGLFAATYMHGSSWRWFWPSLSLPDQAVQAAIVVLNAVFLILFARAFLQTKVIAPAVDRFAAYACGALILLGIVLGYGAPSTHFFGEFTGREAFLVCVLGFVLVVFWLGVGALRAGSPYARFFVASNTVVTIAASAVTVSNFFRHSPAVDGDFIALMTGQAVEGWLLFGALAFRLKRVIGAHSEEQQKRLVAQAEALAQARALLESRQQASTDQLTGIANRRAFDDMYEREWDRCARRSTPLSLLMLDVDFFKKYNDRYGHVAGDECLRRVAAAIASCATRPTDYCARYGGEEFTVVLGDTDQAGAAAIASEVLAAVRGLELAHAASPRGSVSVSIGAATSVPTPGSTPDLLERADRALYRAKERGRDRVEVEERSRSAAL